MAAFKTRYGASPLHVLGHVACFALTAWAISHVLEFRGRVDWFVWFVGGALLHDLLFLPVYTVLDRLAGGARKKPPGYLNYVRVPAVVSGTLLLVWFPLMVGLGSANFERVSGRDVGDERLQAWLVVTAVLFVVSAVLYAVRSRRRDDLDGVAPGHGEPAVARVDG